MANATAIKNGHGAHKSGFGLGSFDDPESVLGRGKHVAEVVIDKGREQIKLDVTQKKDQAASRLKTIAGAVASAADHLRDGGEDRLGDYALTASRYLETMADDLTERSVDELFEQATDFVKNNTTVCVGAGLIVGALIARFIQNRRRP